MSNHSIIEHRANYHFIKMEEDYIAICSNGEKPPHCKALVLAVLEHWMNTKRDKGEKEWIYLSMPQWIKYTYMIYERNVITDSLSELMAEGFVEREPIIMFSQKTFVYRLNIKNIQKAIRALPEKNDQEITPNLDAYIAYKKRAKERAQARREEKQEGVGDKSRTSKKAAKRVREKSPRVREKSRTVREKSPRVREKSPQLIYTKIPSNSTEIENALSSIDETRTPSSLSESNSPSSLQSLSEHHTEEQRETTQPFSNEPAPSEPALPEFASQREEKASGQGNEQSTDSKQTVSHSQSTPNTTQDSAKQAPSEQTKQPELIERPKKPVMPPETMKWNAEKLVQITEALRGKYFTEKQRQGELKAAKKILDEEILEEQYVKAFCDRNDVWWRENNGLLNVTDMAATPKDKSVMRAVGIWQKLEAREEAATQKQGNLKDQKDNLQRKNIVDTGSRLVPPRMTREQLKLTEQEAV